MNDLVIRISKTRLAKFVSNIYRINLPNLPVEVIGQNFSNPIGLAPGLDKDGLGVATFAKFGFGFVELGTVTPKPQKGNPRPRLFRIVEDEAVVNRLGFNSNGLDEFVKHLNRLPISSIPSVVGINLGKNTDTTKNHGIGDYVTGLEAIYPFADYIVINISSPNTVGLRNFQLQGMLNDLLKTIMEKRLDLTSKFDGKKVPISIKISPDLKNHELVYLVESAIQFKVDAITATNTTVTRPQHLTHKNYAETGGLSGKPLSSISTQAIRMIADVTQHSIPIIGVGGVSTAEDAWEKFLAGADLVQLCTSLVYQGPGVVKRIVTGIAKLSKQYDDTDFKSAVQFAREDQALHKI